MTLCAPPSRRGLALIWGIAALPIVIGFVSFAVDYGRVQLAKTELQTGADAAARAAVASIASSITEAQNSAVALAQANTADGKPIVLDPNTDIEFGTWNDSARTFTVLSGSARSTANAMRITACRTAARGNAVQLAFASILGKPTCDVHAVAIAKITVATGGGGCGLVGLDGINISGNLYADSYNAAAGPYQRASALSHGSIESNGWMNINGSVRVQGDARPGGGCGMSRNGTVVITGSTTPMNSSLSFADPTLPSQYTNCGNYNLSGTATLTAGNYYYTNFNLNSGSTLNITGPVTIYVNGNCGLSGTVNVAQNLPQNFKIRMVCSAGVNISVNTPIYADIYAPQSPSNISTSSDFYGALICKSMNISSSGGIHYDESLGYGSTGGGGSGGGGTGTITLVK